MKKDLVIGAVFVVLAAAGMAVVVILLNSSEDERKAKTIQPRSEAFALFAPKATREEPKQTKEKIRVIAPQVPIQKPKDKKIEPAKTTVETMAIQKETPKIVAKLDPVKPIEQPAEPKPVIKHDGPDVIEFAEHRKINRPNGEYTVPTLNHEEKIILRGVVKTLKLNCANDRAIIDASGLKAEEIIVLGEINGDARVKLCAPDGTITFQSQINGNAEVEIVAPRGKVVFSSKSGTIITGSSRLSILAKDIDLDGEINGGVFIKVMVTRDGSLKFSKMEGGPRLYYGKADISDPQPRLIMGSIHGGAKVKEIESPRK